LFVSGVGRPDLNASSVEVRMRAAALYRSLVHLSRFPAYMLVLPGHTSQPVPFDHNPVFGRLDQILTRIASWIDNEEDFISAILPRIPPTPPNYSRIVELNESGLLPEGDPTDWEAGANRCAVL
jgi:hypothetical protein